jgi:hypothetical protein
MSDGMDIHRRAGRRAAAAWAAAVGLSFAAAAAAFAQDGGSIACKADGRPAAVPDLPEASGVAVSRRVPGRLWAHNDSGRAVLVALDAQGAVTARVQLAAIKIDDWEAVAVGPCPAGSCVYIGDIGDNNARRKRITVHRAPEPAGADQSLQITETFYATYPDGAHDAETLFVNGDGRIFIVTKGDTGPVALYRFPGDLRPGSNHVLERVGQPAGPGKPSGNDRITDGAISPDGAWVVLRTNRRLSFYRTKELIHGKWQEAGRVDLRQQREPQGEGVAIGQNGAVYLVSEGGGKQRPGTFSRLTCAFGP